MSTAGLERRVKLAPSASLPNAGALVSETVVRRTAAGLCHIGSASTHLDHAALHSARAGRTKPSALPAIIQKSAARRTRSNLPEEGCPC